MGADHSDQRKHLLASLQRSVALNRQLLAFTTSLADALSVEQIAQVVVVHSRKVLGVLFGGIALVDQDGETLRFVTVEPLPAATRDEWTAVPVKIDAPLGDAFRRRAPLFHESRDSLLADYPHLSETFEAAAAGASANLPLVASGRAVGVLSLSWPEAHPIDDEERAFLETLANQSAQAVERARLFSHQQQTAETLSRAILPVQLPQVSGWELAARYQPAGSGIEVGGDWYDAFVLPDGRVGLAVGDVGGHGIRAAAVMAQLRNALRAYAYRGHGPAKVLALLSDFLSLSEEGVFATAVYAVVDPATGELVWSNAGHPPLLHLDPDGRAELWDEFLGPLLGVGLTTYAESKGRVGPGEVLVGLTDGLVEQRGEGLNDGLERLRRGAESSWKQSGDRFCDLLISSSLAGCRQQDDLCILVARHSGRPTPTTHEERP